MTCRHARILSLRMLLLMIRSHIEYSLSTWYYWIRCNFLYSRTFCTVCESRDHCVFYTDSV